MRKSVLAAGLACGGMIVAAVAFAWGASVREVQAQAAKQNSDVIIVDRCCYDLDGGGKNDDGVLSVTIHGDILMSAIYEDPDGDKKFDKRDDIKSISLGNQAWAAKK